MRLLPALLAIIALSGLFVTTALAHDAPRDQQTQPPSAVQPEAPKPSQAEAPKAPESSSALPQPKPTAGEGPAAKLRPSTA